MRFLFLLFLFPAMAFAQAGPDNNPLKRMDCPTAGEIRNDAGTCVTLATYFSGQTLRHVGQGQTHTTIQAAVDAASATDVIVIHDGTYRESILIDVSNLTLVEYPGDEAILNGADITEEGSTIADSFTDTDAVNLTVHTTNGGLSWQGNNRQDGIIASNKLQITVNNRWYWVDAGETVAEAEVDWTPAVGSRDGLLMRTVNAADHFAISFRNPEGDIRLLRRNSSTYTTVATASHSFLAGFTYNIRASVDASDSWSVYVDDVLVLGPTTDSGHSTATSYGITRSLSTSDSRFDNFTVEIPGWVLQGDGTYRIDYTTSLEAGSYNPANAINTVKYRRDLVIVDGVALTPVHDQASVTNGTFFVEGDPESEVAIYMKTPDGTDPAGHVVEIGARDPILGFGGTCGNLSTTVDGTRLIGLTFRNSTASYQTGSVCPGRDGAILEENTFEWSNGVGLRLHGSSHTIIGNRGNDNGHVGFSGGCVSCDIDYNETNRNDWKLFTGAEGPGGIKIVNSNPGPIIDHHLSRDNLGGGKGIWFDLDVIAGIIRNSMAIHNAEHGIHLEYGTMQSQVYNNVVIDNDTGILIAASIDNDVHHNTIIGNRDQGTCGANGCRGLFLNPDKRDGDADGDTTGVPTGDGVNNDDNGFNSIYNNLFVDNWGFHESQGGLDTDVFDGNFFMKHGTATGAQATVTCEGVNTNDIADCIAVGWGANNVIFESTSIVENYLTEDGWHLPSGSAAINAGVVLPDSVFTGGVLTTDFYGNTRSTADVGAFEFVSVVITDRLAGGAAGSVDLSGGIYTIVGDGHGIRSTSDEGQMLVSSTVGTLEWEVQSIDANADGIFGIVSGCARSSTDDDASVVCIDVLTSNETTTTGNRLVRMTERSGGQPANATGFSVVSLPASFRLEQSGVTWTGKVDDDLDGTFETTLGSGTVTASEVGIIVARGRQGTGSVTAEIEWVSP